MVIGDGPTSGTGFGEELRNIFYRLVQTGRYEITWIALERMGIPIDLPDVVFPDLPYKGATIRVLGNKGDRASFGAEVFPKHYIKYNPDMIFFMGDPRNIIPYLAPPYKWKQRFHFPLFMYITLDGLPVHPHWKKHLEYVNVLVTMTNWAQLEYTKIGLGPWSIHHGVNWDWWSNNVQIKQKLRRSVGIDDDTVLFMNWEIAQHRKRTDALLRAWRDAKPESKNMKLFLYTDWNMEQTLGWNIEDLITQYDVPRETILSPEDVFKAPKYWSTGETQEELLNVARMGDVYASATSGEGFGKCPLEAMSLGMPVIITDYAASSEVCAKGSKLIPITGRYRMDDTRRSVDAGMIDEAKMTQAILELYNNKKEREELGAQAREWSKEFDYDRKIIPEWDNLFNSFNLEKIMMDEMSL